MISYDRLIGWLVFYRVQTSREIIMPAPVRAQLERNGWIESRAGDPDVRITKSGKVVSERFAAKWGVLEEAVT